MAQVGRLSLRTGRVVHPSSVLALVLVLVRLQTLHASAQTCNSGKESFIRVLSESRAIPLLSKCIRQPRYEAAMTEAPAAMANLCRERPTAAPVELVVCNPRCRASLVTPLSIL